MNSPYRPTILAGLVLVVLAMAFVFPGLGVGLIPLVAFAASAIVFVLLVRFLLLGTRYYERELGKSKKK